MSKLHVYSTQEELDSILSYLEDKTYVTFDTETTGVHKDAEVIGFSLCAEEDLAFYVILKAWNPETNQLVDLELDPTKLLEVLKTKQLICHNGVFDMGMVEQNFKISMISSLYCDTMVLAHLLNENRKIGLKELGKAYFGESATEEQRLMKESIVANGGKITKSEYELYKGDPNLIGKYGAQDALLTYKLFLQLIPELYEQGLEDFFFKDESMPLLRLVTYPLNTVGMKVDMDYLRSLKKQLEVECSEAKAFIYDEIRVRVNLRWPGTSKKNTFNIGSNQQLSWLLFGQMGLEFGTLTSEGQIVCKSLIGKLPYTMVDKRNFIASCENAKDTIYQPEGYVNGRKVRAKKVKDPWAYTCADKKTLAKYAPKHKWIAKLLEYKTKSKILDTYVIGVEERVRYGVINPSFLQTGTTSGRYSSRAINFQNLPRDDKRVKAMFIARPGKVLVGADFSQLEPRVFAYYSKDERLLKVFQGKDDFYSTIGMNVYAITDALPIKDGHPDAFGIKYKKYRDLSKVIALASTYGANARQLAPTTGKNIEDTQQDIDNYFEAFPGVKDMMLEAHELAKTKGEVVTIFGRPRRIPEALKIKHLYGNIAHERLPYQARSLLNLAVNHRIQGTGASIVNRSAIKFMENCNILGLKCNIVNQVHDSLVVECETEDAESVSLLLEDAMINTVKLEGINLEAKPSIGKNLSEV